MARLEDAYTRYPRTLLWLVEGGTLERSRPDGKSDRVEVSSFYISKLPVTNEQMEAYDPGWLRAEMAPEDTDPALGVRYDEAAGYCAWYAEVARKPMRLPTVLEWRWACFGRGGWPDPEELDAVAWHADNCDPASIRLPPLDAKGANRAGLYGMLGGIWDWTSTEAEGAPGSRLICGGSYRTPRVRLLTEIEQPEVEDRPRPDLGFRVVKPLGR